MTVNEVAGLLGLSREKINTILKHGLQLPVSKEMATLKCSQIGGKPDVSDEQLDEFIQEFENEEPGRWPPAGVRRELLVESGHSCAICRDSAPPQFHHMLDWSKIKHHDPKRMLVICGTCHSRCTNGQIDYKAQMLYKAKLQEVVFSDEEDDQHKELKRSRDLETIRNLFSLFPRTIAAHILEEAEMDRIHVESIDCLLGAEGILRSTLFHLHDSEVEQSLKEFFDNWNLAWHLGRFSHHDHNHNGIATLSLCDTASSARWDEHKQFLEHVFLAKCAMASLTKRLNIAFPEFDLGESDRNSERKYWEAVGEIEKRIKNMMEDSEVE